jgi:hypothetical protein
MAIYLIFISFIAVVCFGVAWILISHSDDAPVIAKKDRKVVESVIDLNDAFGISAEDVASFGYEKSWPILIGCFEYGIKKDVKMWHSLVQNNQTYIFEKFFLRMSDDSEIVYLIGVRSNHYNKDRREYTIASYVNNEIAIYYKLKP